MGECLPPARRLWLVEDCDGWTGELGTTRKFPPSMVAKIFPCHPRPEHPEAVLMTGHTGVGRRLRHETCIEPAVIVKFTAGAGIVKGPAALTDRAPRHRQGPL